MTRVLILGGTGWLSGHVARLWVAAGADVTCLARGGRAAPEGARLVVGDRSHPRAYDAISGEWDEVVDVSSRAEHVRAAVAALAGGSRHWTYVSSLSVYASDDVAGEDETAAVQEPAEPGDVYDYGREKSASESVVRAALGDRAAIIRPGLIVGPGDPSDRFGYWVGRFALAGDEAVLVPAAPGLQAQVVDVDDVADFVVAAGRTGWAGTANAIGDPLPFAELVDRARRSAGHTGAIVRADDAWLVAHDVEHWMGPRSLPLWLPADMAGFSTRTNAVYRAAGGGFRELDDILARTLDDERSRGLGRTRGAGLTREDELELLAELS